MKDKINIKIETNQICQFVLISNDKEFLSITLFTSTIKAA
jgi:hypothetical protein